MVLDDGRYFSRFNQFIQRGEEGSVWSHVVQYSSNRLLFALNHNVLDFRLVTVCVGEK